MRHLVILYMDVIANKLLITEFINAKENRVAELKKVTIFDALRNLSNDKKHFK